MHPHADSRNTTQYPFLVGDEVTQEEFLWKQNVLLNLLPLRTVEVLVFSRSLVSYGESSQLTPTFPFIREYRGVPAGVAWECVHCMLLECPGSPREARPPEAWRRQGCSDAAAASLTLHCGPAQAAALLFLFQCHITYKVQNVGKYGEVKWKKNITY